MPREIVKPERDVKQIEMEGYSRLELVDAPSLVCDRCGSLVERIEVHDAWHGREER